MERVGLCISLDVIKLHDAVVHIGYLYWLIVIFNLRLRLENRKKELNSVLWQHCLYASASDYPDNCSSAAKYFRITLL